MANTLRLIEPNRLASIAWPSISDASAQIRRRSYVANVSRRAENPAVLGNVASLRAPAGGYRRAQ
ncbi:MAG: hypothetical protein M3546_01270 [Actinomycetota bacterium]|nr:hypothetical protein [Actinomycetota bacterium]